jgi:hypothetical protein
MRLSRSGKVDISDKSLFASAVQQRQEMGAFSLARLSPDQDDYAWIRTLRRQKKEVIAVARHYEQPSCVRFGEDLFIRSSGADGIA